MKNLEEGGWCDEVHLFTRYGMAEPDFSGMEHQSVALRAVELVALDGASQSVGMGAMDAQLVGAACLGIEGNDVRG